MEQIDIFNMQREPPERSQCGRIIRHLRDHKTITSLEAIQEYGILRLASRICDLRKSGFDIGSRTITGKNRYQEDTHYSEYFLNQ